MGYNESTEMYLETIYLLEKNHGHAHGVEIAEELGVSKACVSKAMRQMKAAGLVYKETYGSITLTEKGKAISERIYYHHQLLSRYLEHSLSLSFEEATSNACKLEHVVSEEMLEAIKSYLETHNIVVEPVSEWEATNE